MSEPMTIAEIRSKLKAIPKATVGEDIRSLFKDLFQHYEEAASRAQGLQETVAATGVILLAGRGEEDPVVREWADKFQESPEVLPLIAQSVIDQFIRIGSGTGHTLEGPPNGEKKNKMEERALVVCSGTTGEYLILTASGAVLETEIAAMETAVMTGLILDADGEVGLIDELTPRVMGLWVWKGYPEYAEDGSVDYSDGQWGAPTGEDLLAFLHHKHPWRPVFPDKDGAPAGRVPERMVAQRKNEIERVYRPIVEAEIQRRIRMGEMEESDIYEDDDFEDDDDGDFEDTDYDLPSGGIGLESEEDE